MISLKIICFTGRVSRLQKNSKQHSEIRQTYFIYANKSLVRLCNIYLTPISYLKTAKAGIPLSGP